MLFSRRPHAAVELSDNPLNYIHDQKRNLNPELRRLNRRLALQNALAFASDPSATLLLGGALGALFTRRYALASLLVTGLALQQAVAKRSDPKKRLKEKRALELELERYAVKAQLGDYGKLAVIAFK